MRATVVVKVEPDERPGGAAGESPVRFGRGRDVQHRLVLEPSDSGAGIIPIVCRATVQ